MNIIVFTLCFAFYKPLLPEHLFFPITANQNRLPEMVKRQANIMGQAFIKGDYKVFLHYIYPGIIKLMGGETKMVAVFAKVADDMKLKDMVFNSIAFGEVSKIVKRGNELQCIIPQYIEIKLPGGRIVSTSSLIAISTDEGNDWDFVDTSNKDISTIKRLLPQLSNAIIIPPVQPPVQYNY